jgi:hypothetical protein
MWTPDPSIIITAEQKAAEARQSVERSINAERARRVVAGTIVNGVHVTGTDEDARNLTNLALGAQMRLAMGDDETVTFFRDGDNVDHELTPSQMVDLWTQSASYVSYLYAKSWEIKALETLPEDITEDSLWT